MTQTTEKRDNLVLSSLLLALLNGIGTDFLVITLKGSQVFTSLGELSFLHTLSDVPMDEGTLGVEEIELVVETAPGRGDGSGTMGQPN